MNADNTPAAEPNSHHEDRRSARVYQVAGPSQSDEASQPHVLLVLDELAATLGGGERVILRLAQMLPSWGYRVSILTLGLDPASPFLQDAPCPVYLLPLGRTWDIRAMRAALNLRNFLREQKIRIVQTFFESSDLWVGMVARSVPGIRLVWSRRDMGILRTSKHRVAYRMLRNLPHAVSAVSNQVRRHAIEVDGINPQRVFTVYNGAAVSPLSTSDRLRGNDGPLVVAAVGNIRPVKGMDVLLEAAALVTKRMPNVVFQVAGQEVDAEHATILRQRIAQLGLEDRFRLLGSLADVSGLLKRADVFALPSRSEGFSNAILEAMAHNMPIVATDVGGNSEAVEEELTGFIVPSEQPAPLAEALCCLLEDEVLRLRMGREGRRRVENLFSTESMMRRTVALYQR